MTQNTQEIRQLFDLIILTITTVIYKDKILKPGILANLYNIIMYNTQIMH